MGNVIMKAQQITYRASNVEKALDDLKAPELIELNKRMDAIDAWKANVHEETYTGSELTIENALALPARSLITEINAIQDLHGYDKPWAGGAGKNKLPNNYTGTGTAGVTAVNNSDGSIKLNGTASTTGYILLNRYEADDFKDVPLKISINGVSGLHLYVNGVDANNRFVASVGATTSETTITPTYSNYVKIEVGLQLDNGTTFNGTFYPMIRLASESDATFAPYSNICPISGRDSVAVNDTGLNQFDKDHVSSFAGFIDTATNTYKSNSSYKLCYIPCDGNTTYTISKVAGKTFRVASSVGIPAADVPFINTAANHAGTTLTFTTAADAHYLAVLYWSSANGDTLTPEQIEATLQIEYGTTPTPYEPYAHSSATIQLGTTVYGADINWDTGVGTVKTAVVDMGSLTWDKPRDNRFQSTDLNELIYPNADNVIPPDMKCEIYKPFSANQTATMDFGITAFHYATDNITYLRAMDANINELTAFMAQIDGKKLEYKLATTATIQLTPEQLELLKGYNRVTIESGSIELKALVLGGDN